jgi:hypothetical protein
MGGPTGLTGIRGEAFPARSLIRLDIDSDDANAVRAFQTFRLPELLLSGYRQRFTPSRSIRALQQTAIDTLFDAARGRTDIELAADQISSSWETARQLQETWRPAATTVDRFFVSTMISEEGYLTQMAAVFDAMHPETDEDAILTTLRDQAAEFTASVPDEAIRETLSEVASTYGRVPSEAVADVALDAPFQLGPEHSPISSFDPYERLVRAADELDFVDDVPSFSAQELRERLRRNLEKDGSATRPENPLLTTPMKTVDPERFPTPDVDQVPLSGAARDQAITRCFCQGGFGAVIYSTPDSTDRLINPTVASKPLHEDTYETYWHRAYLGTELLTQLVSEESLDPLDCPLCAISTDQCGGDHCGSRSVLEPISEIVEPLSSALS